MNNKSFYIVFASVLLILCSVCFNGSYAYFSATVDTSGNVASSLTTDELNDIILTGTNIVSNDNLIPGESVSTTFTVQNPNKVDVCFDLEWSQVVNTFTNKNDLVISLIKNDAAVNTSSTFFPSASGETLSSLSIKANTIDTYKLTVTYKDTSEEQSADMSKAFSGTITGVLKECGN